MQAHSDDLPLFTGATSQSRHTSALGAEDAKARAITQARRYLQMLLRLGDHGLTDSEAAVLLKVERSSINARRRPFCTGLDPIIVAKRGVYRTGKTGIKNCIWILSERGVQVVREMDGKAA